jgi:hypothetical protein
MSTRSPSSTWHVPSQNSPSHFLYISRASVA